MAGTMVPRLPRDSFWLANLTRAGYVPVLERLVAGTPHEDLGQALEMVVRAIEAQDPSVIGSILLLDPQTNQLRHGAGARLPRPYREAIDGVTIGPEVGSCGSAASLRTRVVVTDISADPRWEAFRELALGAGLWACWSQPIMDEERVLGTFAMYYTEPRAPSDDALLVIDAAAHLARLAIDRHRARALATEQQRLQQRLWRAQKMESLGILAGGVAHDFNNLLVGVLGSADLAEHKLPRDSPAIEDLHRIQSASVRLAELCKQLLAYSGKGKFRLQDVSLCEVIEEMGKLLEVTLAKDIALEYELDADVPAIDGEPGQLRQVVLNLLTNAAEAMEGRPGAIKVSLQVVMADRAYLQGFSGASLAEGCYVVLQVEDTGCGMDAELVQRIFDPFFTTKFTGRGLGLAAVMGIVRSHRGALRVHSELGRGSSFTLLFPATGRSAPHSEPPGSLVKPLASDGSVLVVDDDETVREVASNLLQLHGFAVLEARDGLEAVRVYREHRREIRLVLLDVVMPRMDGAATLQELRRRDAALPVILCSAHSEEHLTGRPCFADVSGVVQKPFRHTQLVDVVRSVLGEPSRQPGAPRQEQELSPPS